jgi:two-component system, OmpR family, KDP operon response regulator KdpE
MRILVVDDEPGIRRALTAGLTGLGHEVFTARDGQAALLALADDRAEVVILDLGLPDLDGLEVIDRVRRWSKVPIIVLSVRGDQADKIAALDAGADDYVEKPFAMGELAARIGAVFRRSETQPAQTVLRFGELEFDQPKTLVLLAGERISLTPTEFRLLEALVTNPEKLLTHQWLLRKVWGQGYGHESQYLRVYIRRLRSKLGDDPTNPRWIATDPGVGYRWIPAPGS